MKVFCLVMRGSKYILVGTLEVIVKICEGIDIIIAQYVESNRVIMYF